MSPVALQVSINKRIVCSTPTCFLLPQDPPFPDPSLAWTNVPNTTFGVGRLCHILRAWGRGCRRMSSDFSGTQVHHMKQRGDWKPQRLAGEQMQQQHVVLLTRGSGSRASKHRPSSALPWFSSHLLWWQKPSRVPPAQMSFKPSSQLSSCGIRSGVIIFQQRPERTLRSLTCC